MWFFSYAERETDQRFVTEIVSEVNSNNKLPDSEKARIMAFYHQMPVSRIMASSDPKLMKLQPIFESAKLRYTIFRWMKRIAWICLGMILVTFLIVGISVAFSFRSHSAQYRALRIGWPVLRASAAVQVLGQGILAVALSFWVTAVFTHSYFVKLIAVIGILAITAAVALFKAIFAKVNDRFEVSGELVSEADAPSLWQRIRDMAEKLGTAPPDRIIVGIDPNFFVTEHPVTLSDEVHPGRSLYLSLPMLKILAVDEADAVLGHELAHFSGQGTLWSRKISPLISKFALYIQALAVGLSRVVAHFMHFFWKLYNLSIRRLSREREFRADQIGAELVSKDAAKRALVKTTCYCEYRLETEMAVLNKPRVDQDLNLSLQLEQGYQSFLSSFLSSDKAINERVPHPFDTHPTLNNRLAHLGFDAREALHDSELPQPVENSWYQAIITAPILEERMWAERQRALQAFHSRDLAWRLLPKDEEEAAIVLQHFPHMVFQRKKGGVTATLDFDRIQLSDWDVPIFFKDITNTKLEDAFPNKKRLTLTYKQSGTSKTAKTKFYPTQFTSEKGDLLTMLNLYYSRHKTAEARSQQTANP